MTTGLVVLAVGLLIMIYGPAPLGVVVLVIAGAFIWAHFDKMSKPNEKKSMVNPTVSFPSKDRLIRR